MNQLITLTEAAALRAVDRSTIFRWLSRGLSSQRIGNQIVIDRDELMKFVPARKRKGANQQ